MIGLTYYIIVSHFNLFIPCLFHKFTGLLCPGCGITHLILCLAKLDFVGAFNSNPMIFVSSPLIGYYIMRMYFGWLTDNKFEFSKGDNLVIYILLVCFILFFIYRNIV